MPRYVDLAEFLTDISPLLGGYYLAVGLMNGLAAAYRWRAAAPASGRRQAWACAGLSAAFVGLAAVAFTRDPAWLRWIALPEPVKDFLDGLMNPTSFLLGSAAGLALLFLARKFFVRPAVAWTVLNLALLAVGLSLTDPDFAAIVLKPDNVPIVASLFLLGYFTWLGTARAVANDERLAHGEPPLEAQDQQREKVLVWPDLVYIELICMVALTALLIAWALALPAPLEEPADAVRTPNPSKAPWYFLGLQELLVYFDPWMAGVALPLLIIVGLAAIPYLDVNPQGNGYYTIRQRRFAYLTFQFGFLVLWITVMLMGTFLRGPNWSFFGLYETWDAHKAAPAYNVDLSQYFWVHLLGTGRPQVPDGAGGGTRLLYVLGRETPGLVLLAGYFALLPLALARRSRFFRSLLAKAGSVRYLIVTELLLIMGLLPVKMLARWTADLKYIVAMPEYFLNF